MKNTLLHFVAALLALISFLALLVAILTVVAYFSGNRTDDVRMLLYISVPLSFFGGILFWKSKKVREWVAVWIIPSP